MVIAEAVPLPPSDVRVPEPSDVRVPEPPDVPPPLLGMEIPVPLFCNALESEPPNEPLPASIPLRPELPIEYTYADDGNN